MLLRQALLRMGSASPLSRPITTRACGTSVRAASGRSSAAAIRCWVAPPLPAVFTSVRGLASARPALGAKHINLRIKSMRGEAPVANVTKTPFSPALDFTTEPAATFEEMKLHPDIAKALRALGFEKPTDVQGLSAQHILGGGHCVLAAETGSGKSYAYLAPMLSRLLNSAETWRAIGPQGTLIGPGAVILCPNTMLCQQVASAANALTAKDGNPLLLAAALAPGATLRGALARGAGVVVATPARLLEELFAFSDGRWQEHRYPAAVHCVRSVVMDEADMLLQGGFEMPTKRLIQLFDRAEEAMREGLLSKAIPDLPEGFETTASDDEEDGGGEGGWSMGDGAGAGAGAGAAERRAAPRQAQAPFGDEGEALTPYQLVERVHATAPPRQFVFAAATMHSSGKRTPGEALRQGFPDATWIATERLHMSSARLKQSWHQVTPEEKAEAVADALSKLGPDDRCLVFCNTSVSAEALMDHLEAAQLSAAPYHMNVLARERGHSLAAFRKGSVAVLVCTDAAARGLDVPGVTHVVQADFALSAVDYLHRAGRTARAGAKGTLVSFYDEKAAQLVAAVRSAAEAGEPVEDAFSRKRSFTKKLKKFGDSRKGVPDQAKADIKAASDARRAEKIAEKEAAGDRRRAAKASGGGGGGVGVGPSL